MADVNVGILLATTIDNWASRQMTDQYFNKSPLGFWLLSSGRKKPVSGGVKVAEPLMYAPNSTVKWDPTGEGTVDTTAQAGGDLAQYPWYYLTGSISVPIVEGLKNASTEQMVNLLEAKTTQFNNTWADTLATAFFGTGAVSGQLIGLGTLIDATSTVGSINSTTYSWWQSYVESSSAALSLGYIRTGYNTCSDGDTAPDLIATSQTLFEKYESLIQPAVRLTMRDQKLADAGFDSLAWRGAKMVWDRKCTATVMYFLNSQHLSLRPHSACANNFLAKPPAEPVDQFAVIRKFMWMGTLTTNNRRRLGSLTGKTA